MSHSDEEAEAIVNKHIKLLHEYNEAKVRPKIAIDWSIEANQTSNPMKDAAQVSEILTLMSSRRQDVQ